MEPALSLTHIKDYASKLQTTTSSNQLPITPIWWDSKRFDNGRLFFFKYLPSVVLSWVCALLVGLSISRFAEVLACTGHSQTPGRAVRRYRSTLRNLFTWHVRDGWEAVLRVRQAHDRARDTVAACPHHAALLQHGGRVAVSQYDMCVVQTAFIYGVVLYARDIGIYASEQHIRDYIYFWRCIGYMLGIDDKYNICRDSVADTVSLCEQVRDTVLKPSLIDPSDEYSGMLSAFLVGWRFPAWLQSTILHYCLHQLGLTPHGCGGTITRDMALRDYMRLYALRFLLRVVLPVVMHSRYVMRRIYMVLAHVVGLDQVLINRGMEIIREGKLS